MSPRQPPPHLRPAHKPRKKCSYDGQPGFFCTLADGHEPADTHIDFDRDDYGQLVRIDRVTAERTTRLVLRGAAFVQCICNEEEVRGGHLESCPRRHRTMQDAELSVGVRHAANPEGPVAEYASTAETTKLDATAAAALAKGLGRLFPECDALAAIAEKETMLEERRLSALPNETLVAAAREARAMQGFVATRIAQLRKERADTWAAAKATGATNAAAGTRAQALIDHDPVGDITAADACAGVDRAIEELTTMSTALKDAAIALAPDAPKKPKPLAEMSEAAREALERYRNT